MTDGAQPASIMSHATYVACGLKYRHSRHAGLRSGHATYVACGLKCDRGEELLRRADVMPLMWHVD